MRRSTRRRGSVRSACSQSRSSSTIFASRRACSLHADEEAVAEVPLELALEDLHRRRLDVVLDALEVELAALGVENGVARAVVVIARLPDRADAHDVLPARSQ